uniref:Putative ubiquitin-like-specific protease 2B isoform X3 n=1 Tax=Rhizophora mucronata TaxID=61149 RepID=A0A2P2M0B5_RHIMU
MKNGLEVFEFKEEDELPDLAAGKFLSKLKNPSTDGPAILKYEFVDRVQGSDVSKQDIGSLPCVDVNAVECDQSCENVISDAPPLMLRDTIGTKEKISGTDAISQSNWMCHEQVSDSNINDQQAKGSITKLEARVSCCEVPSPRKNQLNHAFSDCPSSSEPVDLQVDADESMNESSPSSHAPGIAEGDVTLDGHNLDQCSGDPKMDDVNIAVDYVAYRNYNCSGCLVTFSSSGIKIDGLTSYDSQETLSIERGIDDIVQIESRHLQRLETVIVKFHILSKDEVQADDACVTSGVEELDFVAVEPNWFGTWKQITALNVKYLAVWCAVNDTDAAMVEGDDLLQQRRYFPNFDEAFEDVVYPKGDSDAVSISKRDVDLLQPETFINDTIIDFYIKYLKNRIPPEEKHRFHFFNSFFFRKLADLDKDPSSANDGRAAFLRVHKWTRKVDIFGKDYVFIPVNFNLHWSLLIMCHPGELAGFKGKLCSICDTCLNLTSSVLCFQYFR